MKVLVVSHMYPWPGAERHLFVHEQTLALTRLGVDARVLSPTPWAPRLLWRDPRQRRRGEKPHDAVRDGIPAWYPRVLQPPRKLLLDRLGDLWWLGVRSSLPALHAAAFDLVHAHQALPDGALASRLATALGVPYVVTVHGADVYQHLDDGAAVRRRATGTLQGAAAVMANSSVVARLLAPVVPAERLELVLNGTTGSGELVPPADDLLPCEDLVLVVGQLIPRKGHEVLLEALALVQAGGRRPHLAVIGEGPLRPHLEARVAELGLERQVHWLGRQPHDRVLALMRRAQLFALPSWDEAFGLVYTEAMTQQTPTLACEGQGPEDFITHGVTGYLAPPRDPRALAGIIREVLEDEAAAVRVGHAGRAAVAGLTWERNARRTLDAYERAAGRPHEEGGR
jgi:glycosyltransferase involved in cell wall biosynthesis